MGNETFYHALKINSEVCTGCTHCMNVCPTAAIRIKYGKATINEAACTDCGMCLKTCPRQAIYVEQDDFNQIFKFSYRIILLPSVFIGQFPEDISEEQIFSELHNLGFHYVMEVDKSTGLLMEETKHYLQQHPRQPSMSGKNTSTKAYLKKRSVFFMSPSVPLKSQPSSVPSAKKVLL